jgi:hypothetical protein
LKIVHQPGARVRQLQSAGQRVLPGLSCFGTDALVSGGMLDPRLMRPQFFASSQPSGNAAAPAISAAPGSTAGGNPAASIVGAPAAAAAQTERGGCTATVQPVSTGFAAAPQNAPVGSNERTVPASDGGPAWTESTLPDGTQRLREVKLPDGAWTEIETTTNDGTRHSLQRPVAAQDGGPDWMEVRDSSGHYMIRMVAAGDGGPDYEETFEPETQQRKLMRMVPSADDHGPWVETRSGDHVRRARFYHDNTGEQWFEVDERNRYRTRCGGDHGLRLEAEQRGSQTITIGSQQIELIGGATPEERATLERIFKEVPAPALARLQRFYVSHQLGEMLNADGSKAGTIDALGDQHSIMVDRAILKDYHLARGTVFHELGHLLDKEDYQPGSTLTHSMQGQWGHGQAVSRYGLESPAEDFAEVHRTVLEKWQRYQHMSKWRWMFESAAQKKAEMLHYYGVNVPRLGFVGRFVQRLQSTGFEFRQ